MTKGLFSCPLFSNVPAPRKQILMRKIIRFKWRLFPILQSKNNPVILDFFFTIYEVFPNWDTISYLRKNENIIFVTKKKSMKLFFKDINIKFKSWGNIKSYARPDHIRSLYL